MSINTSELGFDHEAQEIRDQTKKELAELGIEANRENIEAAFEQQKTLQHPAGYDDVLRHLGNPEALKSAMEARGIKTITHSEGATVWDHAKFALRRIESMALPPERARALKLILLYHDLGKTVVTETEQNRAATAKKLANGELHVSMIGHAKERLGDIQKGLAANRVSEPDLKVFMAVVENHMAVSIMEQDPKKTVALFESFGSNEEEIRRVVELLVAVLRLDGEATGHADLVDGELQTAKNEAKTEMTVEKVWAKYLEGKKVIRAEEEKRKAQEAQTALEVSIFGKKISDYLIQDRGVKPGPDMGKAMGKIKGLLAVNKDKHPEEIKKIIDAIEL